MRLTVWAFFVVLIGISFAYPVAEDSFEEKASVAEGALDEASDRGRLCHQECEKNKNGEKECKTICFRVTAKPQKDKNNNKNKDQNNGKGKGRNKNRG